MSKSHVFTLFLTVIMVLIVGELLSNDYLETGSGGTQEERVTEPTDEAELMHEPDVSDAVESVDEPEVTDEIEGGGGILSFGDFGEQRTSSIPTDQEQPAITFELVEEAGFEDVTLQRVPFQGILFGTIDLRDFQTVPALQQNLLQSNRSNIATFWEFQAHSPLLANEIYLLMKDRGGRLEKAGINETNEFGEHSFYLNNMAEPERAFLVVKKGEGVYAFAYGKGLHLFIASLLLGLP